MAYPATSSAPSFLSYLSDIRFHRRITCHRTSSPVTFSVCGIQNHEFGDTDDVDVILYCLPSGCSRYLGFFLDGIARKARCQLIAIDRPGAGGTRACALEDRMSTSIAQATSVMESLGLIDSKGRRPPNRPPIALLAHSVGLLYALTLLARFNPPPSENCGNVIDVKRSPFGPRPCLVCTSPWVPTTVSKSSLAFLPANVVKLSGSLPLAKLGAAWEASMGVGKGAWQWSLGLSSGSATSLDESDSSTGTASSSSSAAAAAATTSHNPFHTSLGTDPPVSPQDSAGIKRRAAAQRRNPHADFWPPYQSHIWRNCVAAPFAPGSGGGDAAATSVVMHPATGKALRLTANTAQQLVLDLMATHEGLPRAAMSDFLLCLGHCPNLPSRSLESLLTLGFTSTLAHSPQGAEVVVVWAERDGLVPKRGRAWLDDRMMEAVKESEVRGKGGGGGERGLMKVERWEMAEAGHDEPIVCEEVVVGLFRRVKEWGRRCRQEDDEEAMRVVKIKPTETGTVGGVERRAAPTIEATPPPPVTPAKMKSRLQAPKDGELAKRRGSGSSSDGGHRGTARTA